MTKKKKTADEGLPYFKFFPSKWSNGSIDDCSLAAQGLFVNLCVKYWGRSGDITLSGMQAKFKRKQKYFAELISRDVIKVIDDRIEITFLDAQLEERGMLSVVNRENANTRWNQNKSDATASNSHTDGTAIVMPREEKRIEEKREEESIHTDDGLKIVSRESVDEQKGPKPLEQDEFKPLSDEWFNYIFDENYLSQKTMTFREHDISDQLLKFKSKVIGAPTDYIYRDTAGIRKAFDYQLRNSTPQKKKETLNGKSKVSLEDVLKHGHG